MVEHRPVHLGRDRPCHSSVLGYGVVAQDGADRPSVHELVPDSACGTHGYWATAQYAEAHIGTTIGQRKRPGIAGQQVGLKPHVQVGGCRSDV